MKKLSIVLSFLLFAISIQAQRIGFFKPLPYNLFESDQSAFKATGTPSIWILRPAVTITAMQFVPDKTKGFVVNAFNSAGTGVSYNHYIEQNGAPYANYGFTLLLLYGYDIGSITPASLSFAGTVTAWQLVNVGIGYSPQLKKPFLLTGIVFNFNK